MAMSSDLMRATIEMQLLALLRGSPCHAYELAKRAHRQSAGTVHWLEGSLYPTLAKLRRKGFLTSRWEGPATGRKRKVYSLTDKGRQELAVRSAQWSAFAKATQSILRS